MVAIVMAKLVSIHAGGRKCHSWAARSKSGRQLGNTARESKLMRCIMRTITPALVMVDSNNQSDARVGSAVGENGGRRNDARWGCAFATSRSGSISNMLVSFRQYYFAVLSRDALCRNIASYSYYLDRTNG